MLQQWLVMFSIKKIGQDCTCDHEKLHDDLKQMSFDEKTTAKSNNTKCKPLLNAQLLLHDQFRLFKCVLKATIWDFCAV